MTRLAIETWNIRERVGDIEAFNMIKDAGFDAVDYSFYWPGSGHDMLKGDYVAYAKRLREHLDAIGLSCVQAQAPLEMRYGDPFDMACPHYRDIVHSLEFAAILGAKHIVVHAIDPVGACDPIDYNDRFYKSLEPYCQQFDIQIAIENLFVFAAGGTGCAELIGTAEKMKELLNRLSSPCFGLCVDVGHAAITGTQPQELIRALKDAKLIALHIQDTDMVHDLHLMPYMGKHNWPEVMAALKEIGYGGDFTFEVFNALKPVPTALLPDALRYAERVGRFVMTLG